MNIANTLLLVNVGVGLSFVGLLSTVDRAEAISLTPVAVFHSENRQPGISSSVIFDNALYFSADDGVHGIEIWKYDGNRASLVADINPGIQESSPQDLTVFNHALYFGAFDGVHGKGVVEVRRQ